MAQYGSKPNTFGYIPKSEQISHLTVTEQLIEKCDAPQLVTLSAGAKLSSSVGGSHVVMSLSTAGGDAAATLPPAIPGLSVKVVCDTSLADGEAVTSTTTSSSQELSLGCDGSDTMQGSVVALGTTIGTDADLTQKYGCTGLKKTVAHEDKLCKHMTDVAELTCVKSGVWSCVAFGFWQLVGGTSVED